MRDKKRVAFHTLGCKLNFSESSTLARQFSENGFERVAPESEADIYVINTCSVTDHADKKSRNIIRKTARKHPEALIVVTGCYAQLKAEEIAAMPEVDLVAGNGEKGRLFELIRNCAKKKGGPAHTCQTAEFSAFFSAFSSGDRTRSFLKVQDGCNYRCSYCTIPLARGESRNLPIADLTETARKIAARGIREIVLTGVNIGDFGRTTGESFYDLLRSLDSVAGIDRYRISSIEPNLLTEEIVAFTTESQKFQPHFHIPLQAGSDAVLKRMKRRYTTTDFAEKIARIKAVIPDVFIGIDVIVGFPGETEEDFETTLAFLKELAPAYLHIFPYSERANTPAILFPGKIPPEIKAERVKRLEVLCDDLHGRFLDRHIGSIRPVLVEGTRKGGLMFGYTDNYIRAELPYEPDCINTILPVRLERRENDHVTATKL